MTALYIIHWRSSITGKTGHGTQPLMLEDVQAIVARLNREYKYIFHWYETAPRSVDENITDCDDCAGEEETWIEGQPLLASDRAHARAILEEKGW